MISNLEETGAASYDYLPPWNHPRDYVGATWEGWYVAYTQHRDSDILTETNFKTVLAELQKHQTKLPEGTNEHTELSVFVVRESHWAVGWIEWIAVHESNVEACKAADHLLYRQDQYPILDEQAFSEAEEDLYQQTWKDRGEDDFIKQLQEAFDPQLSERTIKFLRSGYSMYLYESAISSGEYHCIDNSGCNLRIEIAVEGLGRDEVAKFLREYRAYARKEKS